MKEYTAARTRHADTQLKLHNAMHTLEIERALRQNIELQMEIMRRKVQPKYVGGDAINRHTISAAADLRERLRRIEERQSVEAMERASLRQQLRDARVQTNHALQLKQSRCEWLENENERLEEQLSSAYIQKPRPRQGEEEWGADDLRSEQSERVHDARASVKRENALLHGRLEAAEKEVRALLNREAHMLVAAALLSGTDHFTGPFCKNETEECHALAASFTNEMTRENTDGSSFFVDDAGSIETNDAARILELELALAHARDQLEFHAGIRAAKDGALGTSYGFHAQEVPRLRREKSETGIQCVGRRVDGRYLNVTVSANVDPVGYNFHAYDPLTSDR